MSTITRTSHIHSALDEPAWRAVCKTVAAQATNGCGQSYNYYVGCFSASIDAQVSQLPEHQRTQALQIAKQEWGYATPAEILEAQLECSQDGFCSHGIQLGYCPVGCDSDM